MKAKTSAIFLKGERVEVLDARDGMTVVATGVVTAQWSADGVNTTVVEGSYAADGSAFNVACITAYVRRAV